MSTLFNTYSAPIHAISRRRMNVDGKGITTLVTFYECPLRCKYCLNPNTLGVIPNGTFLTAEQLFERVKIDSIYFLATGGGVTFGGGEPCLRSDFIRSFYNVCGELWKIRIETSLNVKTSCVQDLISFIDQWIVDIKSCDDSIYKAYTGSSNDLVKTNLHLLAEYGLQEKVLIRLPLIPGYNDERIRQTSMKELQNLGFKNFDLFTYKIS